MGDFTPTTEQVRFAYIDHRDFDSQVGLSEWPGDDEVGWEFDRWLASVKAEAWEQGRRAEEKAWIHVFDGHPVEEGDMCDQCSTDNPYREETNDE